MQGLDFIIFESSSAVEEEEDFLGTTGEGCGSSRELHSLGRVAEGWVSQWQQLGRLARFPGMVRPVYASC